MCVCVCVQWMVGLDGSMCVFRSFPFDASVQETKDEKSNSSSSSDAGTENVADDKLSRGNLTVGTLRFLRWHAIGVATQVEWLPVLINQRDKINNSMRHVHACMYV